MKFEDFSPVQQEAISKDGTNVLVSAGAGSGKTEVLSERVLYFVQNKGYKMSDFLIMTFTKASADEMKERIRAKLKEAKLSEADNVDTADIGTFDSIALNIVKKYHQYLNLEGDIQNVESSIISIKVRNAFIDLLEEEYGYGESIILEYLEKHYEKDDSDFVTFLCEMYFYFERNQISIEDYIYEKFNNDFIIQSIVNPLLQQLIMKREELRELIQICPDAIYKVRKKDCSILDILNEKAKVYLSSSDDYGQLIENGRKLPGMLDKDTVEENTEYSQKQKAHYLKIIKLAKSIKDDSKMLPATESGIVDQILEQEEFTRELFEIVKKVQIEIAKYKHEHSAYEFADISSMALQLVNIPEIQEELRNHYKMIMIDEYQDTDDKQERFVNSFANNNVYQVGDIKQSIYRFRNANPDLFKGKFDSYKNGNNGSLVELSSNFRSRPEVIEDVNELFDIVMNEEIGGIDYIGKDGHSHHLDAPNKMYRNRVDSQNYHMSFMLLPSALTANERREAERIAILNDIVDKVKSGYQVVDKKTGLRPCTFSDFAILISAGTNFDDYVSLFREAGIPISMIKDENIVETDFLQVYKNILKLVACIRNEKLIEEKNIKISHLILSIGRSFIFGMSDEDLFNISKENKWQDNKVYEYFSEITLNNKDLPLTSLLDLIYKDLNIYKSFIENGGVANNENLFASLNEKVASMQSLGFSLKEIVEFFDDITKFDEKITVTSNESELDSVTLMTIHKSKGLEFKVVYFPEMDKGLVNNKSFPANNITNLGMVFMQDIADDKTAVSYLYKKLEQAENLKERIRLLYVAFTRAREKVIIPVFKDDTKPVEDLLSLKYPHNVKSFANLLDYVYGDSKYEYQNGNLNKDVSYSAANVTAKQFDIKKLPVYDFEIKGVSEHASKELELSTNSEILELGTKLHLLMEVIDLKNPDYSILSDNKLETIIRKFLSSPISENIKTGDLYHEYEFYDELNSKSGIIDLFVVYNDHIDIIDFKTSKIDNEEYDKQLKVYQEFLKQKYDLPIKMYLYSLLKGEYREVKGS